MHRHKNWFERIGCRVSEWVADMIAHPFAQIGVIVVCGLWWLVGLPTDILTATLSIMAITLTQMVLNNQAEREADIHRRDVAMHAKLDELVVAMKGARNELVAAEELDESDIEQLKHEVKQAIDEAGEAAGGRRQRAVAKQAVEEELEEEAEKVRSQARKRA
jgi:low affinity Fe/Cu permease